MVALVCAARRDYITAALAFDPLSSRHCRRVFPAGVIDERWIWVFVEVAYISSRLLCKIASVRDSVGSISIILVL